jgi:DNA gyrase subunit A
MGRTAAGVRGIKLKKGDWCVGMEIVDPRSTLLSVTEKGFGKRTPFSSYKLQGRAGQGIITMKVTEKNGKVIGLKTVTDEDELIIITQGGMVVRLSIKEIRTVGRNAQGVKLISLKDKDKVTSVAKLIRREE